MRAAQQLIEPEREWWSWVLSLKPGNTFPTTQWEILDRLRFQRNSIFSWGDNLPNSLDSRLLDSWKPGFTPTKLICTNTCFRLHGFRGRDCGVCDVPFRQATQTGATMI